MFLTQIVEGKMQKVNLCEACSKEKGVTDPTGFALADLLLGLGAAQEIERSSSGERCPACGFSHGDFKKTGRFGCPQCYETFAEGLAQLLRGMHKGLEHKGKMPIKIQRAMDREQELRRMERELKQCVAEEKYEEAARLRDSIRSLEIET